MHVITLDESEFEKDCKSLAVKISESGDVIALIGVRTGGATVAKSIFSYLEKQGSDLEYYEAGASRYATSAKNSNGVKSFFRYVPMLFLDWLRVVEHYIVNLRMTLSDNAERSVSLDNQLVDYLANLDDGRLFIIDDAIDSGATVKTLIDEINLLNPELEVKVAVLVVTQKKPLVSPDIFLYQNVLIRFPWSSDFRR